MNNEQLDSQLSAMFDDELPEPECELVARRLARDEGLKARWGRYAVIAACIRMERGGEAATSGAAARAAARQIGASSGEARVPETESLPPMRLHGGLAGRVSRVVAAEPALLAGSGVARSARGFVNPAVRRWWQPVAGGTAVAAGVAAAAILWLRAGSPDAPIVGQAPVLARTANSVAAPRVMPASVMQVGVPGTKVRTVAAVGAADPSAPDSFVVPPPAPASSFAPPIELANFVVAHSEYSMPLMRRSALSGLVTDEAPTDDAADNRPAAADGSSSGNTPHADSPR